jgi:hypothetical protein
MAQHEWHNYFVRFYVFIFIKNIVSVSPYWCFLGNSVSTYRIRYPYPYLCRLDSDLDCVSLFWDFVVRYSDSVLFCYSLRHFLDFVGHFWDFVHVLQWLGHFYYSDSVILRFCQSFWDFVIHFFCDFVSYFWDFVMNCSDSAILLQCLVIFWFCHAVLQWLSHFLIYQSFLRYGMPFFWFY